MIAVYPGKRRSPMVFGADLIHRHLSFIKNNNLDVGLVTIAVNLEIGSQFDHLLEYNKNIIDELKVDVEFFKRYNIGFSYAAWNDVLTRSISENQEFDRFLIFEDDYVPVNPYIIEILNSYIDSDVGYVCQKVFDNPLHPALGSGMVTAAAARKSFENFERVFSSIDYAMTYPEAELSQRIYARNIVKSGFKLVDYSEDYSVPFFDSFSRDTPYLVELGNGGSEPLIVPVQKLLHPELDYK